MRDCAIVLGSNGFIGRHLCQELRDLGIETIAVARNPSDLDIEGVQKVEFENVASLRPLSGKVTIYNLINSYTAEVQRSPSYLHVNLFLPLEVASIFADDNVNFVQVGSYSEFTSAARAPFSYAWSKKMAGELLRSAQQSGAFSVTQVTLFDSYGPGDTRNKIMTQLARHFANQTDEILIKNPNGRFFPIHVKDTVRYLSKALWSEESEIFAAPPKSIRIEEAVNLFQDLSGRAGNIHWGETEGPDLDEFYNREFSELHSAIGLGEGIEDLLEYHLFLKD